MSKLIIATNENDILHRFWQTGSYEKHTVDPITATGGIAEDGMYISEPLFPLLEDDPIPLSCFMGKDIQ